MDKKDKHEYSCSDIAKLDGYSFDVAYKEYDIMSIDELVSYLKDGWIIYHECGEKSDDMKILSLVNLNHLE